MARSLSAAPSSRTFSIRLTLPPPSICLVAFGSGRSGSIPVSPVLTMDDRRLHDGQRFLLAIVYGLSSEILKRNECPRIVELARRLHALLPFVKMIGIDDDLSFGVEFD